MTVLPGTTPPVAGNVYEVLKAASVDGTFETIELQEGLDGTVNYGDTEVTFTVTGFVPVSVEEVASKELPTEVGLFQNYPNPFNSSTTIQIDMPEAAHVTLTVYDVRGHVVLRLVTGTVPAGRHQYKMDGSMLPSGVYLYRLETDGFSQSRRMMLLK